MDWVVSARGGRRQVREFSEGEIALEREGLSASLGSFLSALFD